MITCCVSRQDNTTVCLKANNKCKGKTSQEPLKNVFISIVKKKDEGKNGFCTFSAFFYLSSSLVDLQFFLIIWTRRTTGGLKNAIFTETKQIKKKKKNKRTLMTGIFHRSYNFYKMPTAFIKYSPEERDHSNEPWNQSNFSTNLKGSTNMNYIHLIFSFVHLSYTHDSIPLKLKIKLMSSANAIAQCTYHLYVTTQSETFTDYYHV